MIDTKLLRQKILDLAIRGKLVPQDPNDEPASVLLEKIRAEKAELVKQGKIKKDKQDSYIYKNPSDNRHYENIPFQVPESWKWCKLENLITITGGGTPDKDNPDFWNGNIPWASVKDMKGDTLATTIDFITEKGLSSKSSISICEIGDLVVATRLVPGKSLICSIRTAINQDLKRIQSYINTCYLHYWFSNSMLYFMNLGKGTTVPGIRLQDLESVLFPLPPLAEQKRIVAAINNQFELISQIEAEQAELADLTKLTKSKILDLAMRGKLVPQDPNDEPASELLARLSTSHKPHYTRLANLPGNWISTTLGVIGKWGAGATPKRTNPDYFDGDIIWLKTGELNNGYVFDSAEKVTTLALKECSLRMNKVGDILIAMYGATIGKLAIVGKELTTNQACCACTPHGFVYNLYLFYYLLAIKNDLIGKAVGGAQPNISKEKIVEHPFYLPPLAEQKRIVAAIESAFALIDTMSE